MSDSPGAGRIAPVQFNITSESVNIARVRGKTREFAHALGFPEADVASIELAVDEAVCNVIRHGYRDQPGHPIGIRLDTLDQEGRRGMQVIIEDECEPVEPEKMVGRDLDDVRPGGLGLHIIRTVMDEIEHTPREGGGMRHRLVKFMADL